MTAESERYRIVRSTHFKPTDLALARPYSRLADAVSDMGDGLVIAEDGHVAAFHERHERFVASYEHSRRSRRSEERAPRRGGR